MIINKDDGSKVKVTTTNGLAILTAMHDEAVEESRKVTDFFLKQRGEQMSEYVSNVNNFTKEQLGTIINVSNIELTKTQALLDEAAELLKFVVQESGLSSNYNKRSRDFLQKLESER